ncbi:SMP-30/gluconolactonase/LRE family protein [Actinotalea sp. M2MS4P-6]|uniref:SMP-30/gluconolactonase/LRE family protein n=1 Tax=Actinotalea sp. M2MS4P-6 TaxID=2983762 RepID=UPI0021E35973|nr:SMP-30/gluconolactonase/LRE family protein [Actinotalea sp. M2MS4P-6]MCV2393741.1 SMP-30/gluconolactonase/LRE family protein [Actinotalea sp. M2MS4P-6]
MSDDAQGLRGPDHIGALSDTYPDPRVRAVDPAFRAMVPRLTSVERIATGLRWAEGPVWFGDHRSLIWSDVAGDRMYRWDERTGAVSVFRQPSGNANGNVRDARGRLVTCEHGGRRVVRTEYDGTLTVLADSWDGKRLNSPNDVAVAPDGALWFTDPVFGIAGDYEGHRAEPELSTNVYRVDPVSGELTVVSDEFRNPNGLAFSPDGRTFYLVESSREPRPAIHAMAVGEDLRSVGEARVVIEGVDGEPDGFAVDESGNLWCGWIGTERSAHGVRVHAADGALLGVVDLPEPCANVVFGGRAASRLFMTAGMSVYSLATNVRGARVGF